MNSTIKRQTYSTDAQEWILAGWLKAVWNGSTQSRRWKAEARLKASWPLRRWAVYRGPGGSLVTYVQARSRRRAILTAVRNSTLKPRQAVAVLDLNPKSIHA